jgi:4-oxalocrotonate tautomerase
MTEHSAGAQADSVRASRLFTARRTYVPLIEVNVFEDELTAEQTKDLIRRLTEAVTTVISPKIRDVVWVVIHEIKSGNWGAGGKPMGVDDIRKMISG